MKGTAAGSSSRIVNEVNEINALEAPPRSQGGNYQNEQESVRQIGDDLQ